jgi:hypothetical protein
MIMAEGARGGNQSAKGTPLQAFFVRVANRGGTEFSRDHGEDLPGGPKRLHSIDDKGPWAGGSESRECANGDSGQRRARGSIEAAWSGWNMPRSKSSGGKGRRKIR